MFIAAKRRGSETRISRVLASERDSPAFRLTPHIEGDRVSDEGRFRNRGLARPRCERGPLALRQRGHLPFAIRHLRFEKASTFWN
jgi:hypothetical protein